MSVTYSTNWMGPINADWIKEHGDHWAAGRIDIYGVEGEHYPLEYRLPPMHIEDWLAFSEWLRSYTSKELRSFDGLVAEFEWATGKTIRWWKEGEQ